MHGGATADLQEELAEDALSDDGVVSLPRHMPPPFAVQPYPCMRFSSGRGAVGSRATSLATADRAEVVANLFTGLLGVGVLALPRALSRAGLLGGLLAAGLLASCSLRSLLSLLGLSSGTGGDRPYLDLVRQVLGAQAFAGALIAHLLLSGGLLVAYLVAVADVLGQAAAGVAGRHEPLSRAALTVLAVAACTPGALTRELRYVGPLGTMAAVAVLALLIALVLACFADLPLLSGSRQQAGGWAEDVSFGVVSLGGILGAARTLSVQFAVHAGALELCAELDAAPADSERQEITGGRSNKYSRSWACHPENRTAVRRAYTAAGPLLVAAAGVGYLRFGTRSAGNVLLSFDFRSYGGSFIDIIFIFAQAVYTAVLVIGFAFLAGTCRNSALELFFVRRTSGAGNSAKTFYRSTASILVAAGWLAWLASDLEFVLNCTGVLGALPISLVLPALLSIEAARQRDGRAVMHPWNFPALGYLALTAVLWSSALLGFAAFALVPPAGHSGHRIQTHSLLNITTHSHLT